jgi:high-affinity Fe2+/Pb2+ permease
MTVSSTRATVYALLFGLAVAVNVFLWADNIEQQWRMLWAFFAFAVCTGLLRGSFHMAAGDAMSEHKIKTLGAED